MLGTTSCSNQHSLLEFDEQSDTHAQFNFPNMFPIKDQISHMTENFQFGLEEVSNCRSSAHLHENQSKIVVKAYLKVNECT